MSVEVITLGCRLNSVEGDTVAALAAAAGHRDLVVVNGCAVTSEAVRRTAGAVRKAARERPGTPVVVTGCAAQTEPARFAAMPDVARVVGNDEKLRPDTWRRGGPAPARITVGDVAGPAEARAPVLPEAVRVRAFLPVQNGCDHRCTFCAIPFGRGRSRSLPVEAAIAAARGLVARGAREVVLTGVDLTAYGADLPEPATLGTLVRALLRALPEMPRLRLSSVDSVEADPELLRAFAEEERLMPHLHLSLQAGDDLVLKRMKRRHRREDALSFCRTLRGMRPDIVFGADLIAGFPTETEAMFARTLDLVEECGLTHLHVFPFSPRPGTPAARMPAVPEPAVRERAARLRAAGERALSGHLAAQVGRRLGILVEQPTLGRTEGFAPVRFARPIPKGALVGVEIAGQDGRELLAAA